MAAEAGPITDGNEDVLGDIQLIAAAVHDMSHIVHLMAADLAALRQAWDRYEPVVAAFQRGGLLAARTARRRNGGSSDAGG